MNSPPVTTPWLYSLLEQVVGADLTAVRATCLKRSAAPATSYRLDLAYSRRPPSAPETLIAKFIGSDWDGDDHGPVREPTFYAAYGNRLPAIVPRHYYAGPGERPGEHLLLLADIEPTHRLLRSDHCWQPPELRRAMKAYAGLHHAGRALPGIASGADWHFPRYEQRVVEQVESLPAMITELADWGGWRPLPGIERLVATTLDAIDGRANEPVTLLHNDTAPQNIAFPVDDETAQPLLIDWEMAGRGLPELDLAYLFMQPYDNARAVDRAALLATYYDERDRLGDGRPDRASQQERQRYADRVLALWFVPVAHDRVLRPFPPGSEPHRYWHHMLPVLERRLSELAN